MVLNMDLYVEITNYAIKRSYRGVWEIGMPASSNRRYAAGPCPDGRREDRGTAPDPDFTCLKG